MTNTVPVLIEELEGRAINAGAALEKLPDWVLLNSVWRGGECLREGPTVQVPASLVGGE